MMKFNSKLQIPVYEGQAKEHYEKEGIADLAVHKLLKVFPYTKYRGDFIPMSEFNSKMRMNADYRQFDQDYVELGLTFFACSEDTMLKFKNNLKHILATENISPVINKLIADAFNSFLAEPESTYKPEEQLEESNKNQHNGSTHS